VQARPRLTKRLGESVKHVRTTATRFGMDHYDAVGLGLFGALAGWTIASAAVRGGNPIPQLVLLVTATTVYAIGRVLGRYHPVLIAAVIVLIILITTVVSGPRALAGGPLDPPLGYGNANGAFYALGTAAAAIIGRLSSRQSLRWAGAAIAVLLLVLTALTTSKAATVLAGCILLIAVGAHRLGRPVLLVAPVLVLAAVAVTVVVGLTRGTAEAPGADEVLTERRAELWQEALDLTAQEPIFGVGPGLFAETSPAARGDADAMWAHSAYLQTAAETGLPGAFLLGAVILWSFGALYRSQQDLRLVVIGTAAAAAFAIHAAVDYVMHFPALILTLALVVGLASTRRRGEWSLVDPMPAPWQYCACPRKQCRGGSLRPADFRVQAEVANNRPASPCDPTVFVNRTPVMAGADDHCDVPPCRTRVRSPLELWASDGKDCAL
jgi:O-antigen ligase